MSIRGFDGGSHPVYLYISEELGTAMNVGAGPFEIDGSQVDSELWDAGLLVQVGSERFFIPWQHVRGLRQVQDAPDPSSDPTPGGAKRK